MGVADFQNKVAVVIRDDLAPWQRLNVTAFLISGITPTGGDGAVGPPYEDADGVVYLPMLRQPVLVSEADRPKLKTVHRRGSRARRGNRDLHARAVLKDRKSTRLN